MLVVEWVKNRFPGLVEYAQQQIEQIPNLGDLYHLRRILNSASDEEAVFERIDLVVSFKERHE